MYKPRRVWFNKPCWYWFGPATLLPVLRSADEFHRFTLTFGWTVTGRVTVAVKTLPFPCSDCGDDFSLCPDCGAMAAHFENTRVCTNCDREFPLPEPV